MSHIMEKVLETEKECTERTKAAREAALKTTSDADAQAECIIKLARQRSAQLSDEIIEQAKAEAGRILEQGKRDSDEAAQKLKNDAAGKFDIASKAVASMLLKIS